MKHPSKFRAHQTAPRESSRYIQSILLGMHPLKLVKKRVSGAPLAEEKWGIITIIIVVVVVVVMLLLLYSFGGVSHLWSFGVLPFFECSRTSRLFDCSSGRN